MRPNEDMAQMESKVENHVENKSVEFDHISPFCIGTTPNTSRTGTSPVSTVTSTDNTTWPNNAIDDKNACRKLPSATSKSSTCSQKRIKQKKEKTPTAGRDRENKLTLPIRSMRSMEGTKFEGKDARAWFDNLPSGKDRAAAMAISDKAFINMFVDLAWRKQMHHAEGYPPHPFLVTTDQQDRLSYVSGFESMNLKEVVYTYNKYLLHDLASPRSTIGTKNMSATSLSSLPIGSTSFSAIRMPIGDKHNSSKATTEEVKLDEKLEKFKDGAKLTILKEELCKDNFALNTCKEVAGGETVQSNHDCDVKVTSNIEESGSVTTLHFKSGFLLPILNNSKTNKKIIANTHSRKKRERTSLPIASTHHTSVQTNNDVHQNPCFSALCSSLPSTDSRQSPNQCPIKENKKKKAQTSVVASKNSASRALLRSSEPYESKPDNALLQHVRLSFTSALNFVLSHDSEGRKLSKREGIIEMLTIDPDFLADNSENSNSFYGVAQEIIRREQKRNVCFKDDKSSNLNDTYPFLKFDTSTTESADGLFKSWGQWLRTCVNPKDSSIHMLILLLARLEFSILQSYYRYLHSRRSCVLPSNEGSLVKAPPNCIIGNLKPKPASEPPTLPLTTVSYKSSSTTILDKNAQDSSDDASSADNFFTPPEIEEQEIAEVGQEEIALSLSLPIESAVKEQNKRHDHENDAGLELDTALLSLREVFQSTSSLAASTDKEENDFHSDFDDLLHLWEKVRINESLSYSIGKKINEMLIHHAIKDSANSFDAKNLFLVPLSTVPMISKFSNYTESSGEVSSTSRFVQDIISKWDRFTNECLVKITRVLDKLEVDPIESIPIDTGKEKPVKESEPQLDSESKDDFSLFLFEDGQRSTTGKKKNKKKKKKKRKTSFSSNAGNAIEQSKKSEQVRGVSNRNVSNKECQTDANQRDDCEKDFTEHSKKNQKVTQKEQKSSDVGLSANAKTISSKHAESSQEVEAKSPVTVARKSSVAENIVQNDIKVSRLSGVSGRCVVGGGRVEEEEEQDNADAWETVEPKGGRNFGKNKKSSNFFSVRSSGDKPLSDSMANSSSSSSTSVRNKNKGKLKLSRMRTTKRIVKDIFNSILDSVDNEITQKRRDASKAHADERRRINSERRKQKEHVNSTISQFGDSSLPCHNSRAASLKDVTGLGSSQTSTRLTSLQSLPSMRAYPEKSRFALPTYSSQGGNNAKNINLPNPKTNAHFRNIGLNNKSIIKECGTNSKVKNRKAISLSSVDQSTVPTLPETLSGVSATTQSTSNTDEADQEATTPDSYDDNTATNDRKRDISKKPVSDTVRDDDSCTSVEEGEEPSAIGRTSCGINAAPPLQTLLGPGNTNSASSSVASSLEAPHATRHRPHRHGSCCKEDDVGYHLLNVCEKLSDDMNTFMGRRALALNARRRERGALLVALQETLQNIWAGRCRVEMYGSCATQLDLPSSDLDVVICGLDHGNDVNMPQTNSKTHKSRHRKHSRNEEELEVHSLDEQKHRSNSTSSNHHQNQPGPALSSHHNLQHHQFYPPLSSNGSRVMRLSAELEQQPWAVQVKAIPTATVPVIKILADPSRLPGAAAGVDWMIHQQHMAAAVAAGVGSPHSLPIQTQHEKQSGIPSVGQSDFFSGHSTSASHLALTSQTPNHYHAAPPPWRGADVMNGLISVDITFEGPEHGGIGSTAFSARVVQESCNETGLPPENTPAVQVIMVIKELLAQRRLNEPFSGGLSSYAILLLVVGVLKERRAIREEMKRVEMQRMAVAAESGSSAACSGVNNVSSLANSQRVSNESSNTQEISHGREEALKKKGAWSSQVRPSVATSGEKRIPSLSLDETISSIEKTVSDKKTNRSHHEVKNNPKPVTCQDMQSSDATSNNLQQHPKSSWASIAKKTSNIQPCIVSASQSKNSKTKRRNDDEKKSGKNRSVHSSEQSTSQIHSHDEGKISEKSRANGSSLRQSGNACGSPIALNSGNFLFPQGSNDVLEVLCSGEPTAGKLLMHFMLFYGQLFDAQSTCVDVRGTHHPDYTMHHENELSTASSYPHLSPFIPRKSGGSYDVVTGVYTVDPVVVYDPLEGAESNNVARSCFAWSSIRWVFQQCYNTLSGVVEQGAGAAGDRRRKTEFNNNHPIIAGNPTSAMPSNGTRPGSSVSVEAAKQLHQPDGVSPLLELMLSF